MASWMDWLKKPAGMAQDIFGSQKYGILNPDYGLFPTLKNPSKTMNEMGSDISKGAGAVNAALGGKPDEQLPTYSEDVQKALDQIMPHIIRNLIGQRGEFGPIEDEARANFASQTIPGLAERFTALGSGGSQRSSAFQGALGSAGSSLERSLATLKSQHGLQQQELAGRLFQSLLGTSRPDVVRHPGILESAGPGVADLAGKFALLKSFGYLGLL